jgi:hypothetical protein
VLYDEVNDGFVFIKRTFTTDTTSIRFDFLALPNLSLRTVLTTKPVPSVGRGCLSEYLVPTPGEIVLTPGCLNVAPEYIGADGNIHIKL